jgi:hypothetical protein
LKFGLASASGDAQSAAQETPADHVRRVSRPQLPEHARHEPLDRARRDEQIAGDFPGGVSLGQMFETVLLTR